jgi:hypothetical protein
MIILISIAMALLYASVHGLTLESNLLSEGHGFKVWSQKDVGQAYGTICNWELIYWLKAFGQKDVTGWVKQNKKRRTLEHIVESWKLQDTDFHYGQLGVQAVRETTVSSRLLVPWLLQHYFRRGIDASANPSLAVEDKLRKILRLGEIGVVRHGSVSMQIVIDNRTMELSVNGEGLVVNINELLALAPEAFDVYERFLLGAPDPFRCRN